MKNLLLKTFMLYIVSFSAICQFKYKKTVYLLPGQGSDERIFEKIKLDTNFIIKNIKYPIPEKKQSLAQFSKQISTQIDTTKNYILIGVSLGGMICCELAEFLKPKQILIISSAKNRAELPKRYKFQKTFPINKIIPRKVIYWGAKFLQPIVEPDRNNYKTTFKAMLGDKNPKYLKRTANMIINWERQIFNKKIIHIHGNNDHTLPIKNIKADYIIENGSHMMTLTKGEEINALILKILLK
jgi:pimeloyl-ACP methyl ester carboxylesterase